MMPPHAHDKDSKPYPRIPRTIDDIFELNVINYATGLALVSDPITGEIIMHNPRVEEQYGSVKGRLCHEVMVCGALCPIRFASIQNGTSISASNHGVPGEKWPCINVDFTPSHNMRRARIVFPPHPTSASPMQNSPVIAAQERQLTMSKLCHEIRAAVNLLSGPIDLLDETALDHEQRQLLDLSKKAVHTLMDIMNGVLDQKSVLSAPAESPSSPIRLKERILDITTLFSKQLLTQGLQKITLKVNLDPETPDEVRMNGLYLQQILINLLTNAVKYTIEGFVELNVKLLDRELLFSIADTGIGIHESQLQSIFLPHHRGDHHKMHRFEGVGLGLSISKELVEKMQGRIWAENRPSGGSVFHVLLPVHPVDADMA